MEPCTVQVTTGKVLKTMKDPIVPGLASLKERLDQSRKGIFFHEKGYEATLGFEWRSGAHDDELMIAEQALKKQLPMAYRQFLKENNGATLFYDVRHGQWGFRLFGTDELVTRQDYWLEIYEMSWQRK
jgi:hypothetical protein